MTGKNLIVPFPFHTEVSTEVQYEYGGAKYNPRTRTKHDSPSNSSTRTVQVMGVYHKILQLSRIVKKRIVGAENG